MREIAKATGKDIRDINVSTFRPPAENIKLGILAEAAEGKNEKKR